MTTNGPLERDGLHAGASRRRDHVGRRQAALKQATGICKARVKEQAQFQEMSWYAKHKAVKNCIKETLAHH